MSRSRLSFGAPLVAQSCLQCRRLRFDAWVGKIPWRREEAAHSSILSWRTPWTVQFVGSQRVRQDWVTFTSGFPGGSYGKASACSAGDLGLIPGLGFPWRRKWYPTPVLLPGKSHGRRSLTGYSPWGHRESDMSSHFTSLWWLSRKESACSAGDLDREDPLRRAWLPTPAFLPGESHGQRSRAGDSPQGHTEWDVPEHSAGSYWLSLLHVCVYSCVHTQPCPHCRNPMDRSPPGPSVEFS